MDVLLYLRISSYPTKLCAMWFWVGLPLPLGRCQIIYHSHCVCDSHTTLLIPLGVVAECKLQRWAISWPHSAQTKSRREWARGELLTGPDALVSLTPQTGVRPKCMSTMLYYSPCILTCLCWNINVTYLPRGQRPQPGQECNVKLFTGLWSLVFFAVFPFPDSIEELHYGKQFKLNYLSVTKTTPLAPLGRYHTHRPNKLMNLSCTFLEKPVKGCARQAVPFAYSYALALLLCQFTIQKSSDTDDRTFSGRVPRTRGCTSLVTLKFSEHMQWFYWVLEHWHYTCSMTTPMIIPPSVVKVFWQSI